MNVLHLARKIVRKVGRAGYRANALLLSHNAKNMPLTALGTPGYIQVEIINRCNLRCTMCPIEELTRTRRSRRVAVEELQHILSQFPYLQRMSLQGIGEPLAHPDIIDLIAAGVSRNVSMHFVTNGTLLDEEIGRKLIKVGLEEITISIDSVVPSNFEAIRRGAKFDEVVGNIKRFLSIRDSLALGRPRVNIMTVVMNENFRELIDLIEFAHELGVDRLTLKGLNYGFVKHSPEVRLDGVAETAAFQAAVSRYSDLQVVVAFLDRDEMRCRWPWKAAYITAEGDVTPCCNCPNAKTLHFGNVFEQPFKKIWNNPEYRSFRRQLKSGTPPDICRTCPDYFIDSV